MDHLDPKEKHMLLDYLNRITDHRRPQSRQYDLAHMLLFIILWILSWCTSYRELESFMVVNFKKLKNIFWIERKKVPDYSTIRNIIIEVKRDELENALRDYASDICDLSKKDTIKHIAADWKVMRWSFDHFNDEKAVQMLSLYLWWEKVVVWHKEVEAEKTNEIPVFQKLILELWLEWVVYTADAMHCQKKP